ncbi:unnamed protein product [Effrenium voratum]|nr:unnamed protein product [Effrenium voratum]
MTETHHGKGMLMHAVQNHVESFNAFLEHGLETVLQELGTTEVEPWEDGPSLKIFVSELTVSKPVCKAKRAEKEANSEIEMQRAWLPSDCRMSHATYGGALTARIEARVEGGQMVGTYVELGDIPLMVRSKKCNLCGLSPEELVRAREDCTESGGYFLLRGLERIIRLLVMPKCNFPMAINRPSYESRGKLYTQHAVLMRCMRADGSTLTNTLHYCRDGSVTLRFSHGREEWLIPLIVVAHSLYQVSDRNLAGLCGA